MQKAPRDTEKPPKPTRSQTAILLTAMADTSWRMFVPTIGMLLLGRWIDSWLGTTPIALLIGLTLGVIASIWLVTKQIKEVS